MISSCAMWCLNFDLCLTSSYKGCCPASLTACLCHSGTLWMTWSPDGSTWSWNGFLQCLVQSDWTRSVLCVHLYHPFDSASLCLFKHSFNFHYWRVDNEAASYIMQSSHIPARRAHYSHCRITIRPNWLCFTLQVLQLQSLQSYHNKAVPSAALLFVHIEGAHSLPVSHLQFICKLCSS